jgi:hypothetical protein
MRRVLLAASVACLLWPQIGAAGPYDGEWNGSATATTGRCKPARVTLIIAGKVVTGSATLEGQARNIHGTVKEDGTFGATISFQHLTGQFTEHMFEGAFNGFGCAWKMMLRIDKPR